MNRVMEWADVKLMIAGQEIKNPPSCLKLDFEDDSCIFTAGFNKDSLGEFFDHVLKSMPPKLTLCRNGVEYNYLISRFEVALDAEIKDKYYIKFYGRECGEYISNENN